MPVLVKLRRIKWHYKSILILLQQILWTCCIFLSSINNTFFSVLIIIFINMSHFCFSYTDTFFIHTMNYFSVVLRIIFLVCMENYFFIGPRIIFRSVANLFCAYNALWALQLRWTGSSLWLRWATILKTLKWRSAFRENATAKHCQGKKQKRFSCFLQNLSAASSLCVHDEVFWTEDLVEETMKRLHYSHTILTVIELDMSAGPIEQFSTQSYTSSLRPILHMLAFRTKMWWIRVPPTLNFSKDLPILVVTGGHKNKNQSNFSVSEVYSN